MDLFNQHVDKEKNLLPCEGTVNYYGPVLMLSNANHYMDLLLKSIEWKNDEAVIFGRLLITKRKVAWYGDRNFEYTYSNKTKMALPWTAGLLELKELAENTSGEVYNSCLLNLYHDGSEGMAWHSDGEKDLKKNGAIASMSFGAERKFSFKNKKSRENVSIILQHGSLLVMKDSTQSHWLHRLPPAKRISTPRINLTFRTIVC
jgi:alkylated DNA repair dioxygenase AlkB